MTSEDDYIRSRWPRSSVHLTDLLTHGLPRPIGWSTGITELDLLATIRERQLWVITGAPRAGKTKLACQWAFDLAVRDGVSVLFNGTERESVELYQHWFTLNIRARDDQQRGLPLSRAPIRVTRGTIFDLHEAWIVRHPDAASVLVFDDPSNPEVSARQLRDYASTPGRAAIATVLRSQCIEQQDSASGIERLFGPWADAADVIVEVIETGTAFSDLRVWKNLRGPLGTVRVITRNGGGRFVDPSDDEWRVLTPPLPTL